MGKPSGQVPEFRHSIDFWDSVAKFLEDFEGPLQTAAIFYDVNESKIQFFSPEISVVSESGIPRYLKTQLTLDYRRMARRTPKAKLASPHTTQRGDCSLQEGHPDAQDYQKNERGPLPQVFPPTVSCPLQDS